MTHEQIKAFDIEKDLEQDRVLKIVRKGITRENGEVLFDPDLFKGKGNELKINENKLSHDQLYAYAKMATEIRRKFKDRADAARSNQGSNADVQGEESKDQVQRLQR